MRFFTVLLLFSFIFTTGCFSSDRLVSLEDDKVRFELQKDIAELESDEKQLQQLVDAARERLRDLSISPKMLDIAKKDLYAKESFLKQVNQHIAYLQIKVNDRMVYFVKNQKNLTKEMLEEDLRAYQTSKLANPVKYPWRILNPEAKQPPAPTSSH